MAAKYGGKAIFGKSRQLTTDILGVKNFNKISLSCTISEINAFLRFTQKFKMAAKYGGKAIFGKSRQLTTDILGVKNFNKISLSCTISEINAFLRFTQKFKMPTKMARKMILGKSHQFTLLIPWGSKLRRNRSIMHSFRDKCVHVFYAEIQDDRQKSRENDLWEMSSVDSAYTLEGQKFRRNCSILHRFRDKCINVFYTEIQDGCQKWRENNFRKK